MGNREVKSDIRSVARSLQGCGRLLALVITEQVLKGEFIWYERTARNVDYPQSGERSFGYQF